jgi:hypothetical protein
MALASKRGRACGARMEKSVMDSLDMNVDCLAVTSTGLGHKVLGLEVMEPL